MNNFKGNFKIPEFNQDFSHPLFRDSPSIMIISPSCDWLPLLYIRWKIRVVFSDPPVKGFSDSTKLFHGLNISPFAEMQKFI
jgi:hypothetical protein